MLAISGLTLVTSLVLALLPDSAGAQRRVQVYKAKHRTAEELVPIAQAVIAGSGSVALDRGSNSLVLIGDPSAVADVLALLATEDRALRSVLLRYDTRRVRDLAEQGYQVRWTTATGALRLGNLRIAPDQGSSIRVRASDAMHSLVESFSGKLRVLEGEATRIETGTLLPYTTKSPSGTSTEFVKATTGFEAKARILADGRVQVDLAAFAHQLRLDRNLDSMAASTLVIVKPGAVVVVGSSSEVGSENRARTLDGKYSVQRRDETVLLLRADIE